MERCRFCQGEFDPATRRCVQCGQVQPEAAPTSPADAPPQARLSRRAMLAGLAGLAIGGVGMIGLGALALRRLLDIPHTLVIYRGHSAPIQSIAWSPDSTRIASSALDGAVRVWDASTGSTLLTYYSHDPTPYMKAAVWSPDARYIASSCLEGRVQVWEATSGQRVALLGGVDGDDTPLAWSPDSARLALIDDLAQVWEVAPARLLLTHQSQPVQEGAIAWSPDGTRLATVVDQDNQQPAVEVWDATSGQTLLTYRGHQGGSFLQVIDTLAWSSDSTRLVSGGSDGTAQVWNATSGKRLLTYLGHKTSPFATVTSVSWSPDGKRIVSTGSSSRDAQVWDATTGELLLTTASLFFDPFSVDVVAWSPDGARIASGGEDNIVRVWQIP